MPILAQEPDIFPPELLSWTPSEEVDPDIRRWWVAHTRPRQEKAVARELIQRGVPYYLPCESKRVKIRGEIVTSHIPLFSGYVFIHGNDDERVQALSTNRLASLIKVNDQKRFLADLNRVWKVLDLGEPITREQKLQPGDTVTVRDGPLTGTTGTVVRSAGGFKFVVKVDFIQQGISIIIDGKFLGLPNE